ncbi:MAG TPA: RidA family protein [Nitrolancea sp.]|jgi:2-iminobutanoate/2-iminopropanoate deaminase|nr:RidA family protein [Nitrolancea sp.]
MAEIEFIQTPKPGETRPFSRATKAAGLVFVSGISGGVSGSATEEARAALQSMKAVLEEAGTSMDRVIEVTLLITNSADYQEINAEYVKHFSHGLPARHTVRFGVPTQAKCGFACIALA